MKIRDHIKPSPPLNVPEEHSNGLNTHFIFNFAQVIDPWLLSESAYAGALYEWMLEKVQLFSFQGKCC